MEEERHDPFDNLGQSARKIIVIVLTVSFIILALLGIGGIGL